MKLRQREKGPPGGWAYKQPETGRMFKHYDLSALLEEVSAYRRGNGLPMPADWVEKLEDEMCEQNKGRWPEEWCGDPPPPPNGKRHVGIRDIFRFMATVEHLAHSGWKSVPQEEAERRAAICIACPHNLRVSCLGCNGISRMVSNMMGKRGTSLDDKLQSCDICGCVLKLKVQLPLEVVVQEPGLQYPTWCWQHVAVRPESVGVVVQQPTET